VQPAETQLPPPLPVRRPARPPAGPLRFVREEIEEWLYVLQERVGAARRVRWTARWLAGRERHTGAPLRVRYVGALETFDDLVARLYADYTIERQETGLLPGVARRFLGAPESGIDLLVGDLPWPYYRLLPAHGALRVPGWIVQKLPLAETWDGVVAGFRRNTRATDLRKIRKHGIAARMTRSSAEIDHFYERLYLPYARRRFGPLALVDSHREIASYGRRGGLLQVVSGQRVLAGVILFPWRATLHFLWIGLADDLEPALADAAQSGVYYFAIQQAYAGGSEELDLSYTRPLLDSVIYRYKRKWGAGVVDDWRLGEIRLRPLHLGPAVRSCFVHQPWIARSGGRLIGKILLDPETAGSPEAIEDLVARYTSPGIGALHLYADRVPEGLPAAPTHVELRSLQGHPDPARWLCSD